MKEKFSKIVILLTLAVTLGVIAFALSNNSETADQLFFPLDNFEERPKLLTFGLYVTPDPSNNPIDPPERFNGFHTALDLEILDSEQTKDINVYAACPGKIIYQQTASGYGGVLVQTCRINNQDITVLYGHLDPNSFEKKLGDTVKAKEKIAILGDHKSEETGNTRKHLHFGVHEGLEVMLAGYVETEAELDGYLDPLTLF